MFNWEGRSTLNEDSTIPLAGILKWWTMLYPLKSWAKTNCSFMFLLTRAQQRERKLTQRKTESRTKSKEVTWWLWGFGGHRCCLYVSDWMSPTSLRGLDTWCPLLDIWEKLGSIVLLKEVRLWGLWGFRRLATFPVHSLCFLIVVQDVSSQLPAPATYHLLVIIDSNLLEP